MKYIIIGNRGSGKTSFAKRLAQYWSLDFYDLDKEISPNTSEYFESIGELEFRKKEQVALNRLNQNLPSYVISLGAGYKGTYPNDCEIIWIKRDSDEDGRIFLDRPRLEKQLLPLEEYFQRKSTRDLVFKKYYHRIISLPEGFNAVHRIEKDIFTNQFHLEQYCYTIAPDTFKNKKRIDLFFKQIQNWNIKYFEIRNDLLDKQQIEYCLDKIPSTKLLLSFRSESNQDILSTYLQKHNDCRWDWAHELGSCNFKSDIDILSIHDASIQDAITISKKIKAQTYKIAPLINTLEDLQIGHQWLQECTGFASFLPRSQNGKWKWYRQWVSPLNTINFLRNEEIPIKDQPTLLEASYYYKPTFRADFAAVLGSPVQHSLSPATHYTFFQNKGLHFFAIDANSADDIKRLIQLGLKYAAVTSPLKKEAFYLADQATDMAKQFQSANTLFIKDKVYCHNTDIGGLKAYVDDIEPDVVIWGGGGVLAAIQAVFPEASPYSARSATAKKVKTTNLKPKTLIWAIGREHYDSGNAKWPPADWQIQQVIDLNYKQNSPGLEYAQKVEAHYISGHKMFWRQAQEQQSFWQNQK